MGLGKTLTMISLILKSMESKMENDDSDSDSDSDDKLRNYNAKSKQNIYYFIFEY